MSSALECNGLCIFETGHQRHGELIAANANCPLHAVQPRPLASKGVTDFLRKWMGDGRLQTYEDRERFRKEAGELLRLTPDETEGRTYSCNFCEQMFPTSSGRDCHELTCDARRALKSDAPHVMPTIAKEPQ